MKKRVLIAAALLVLSVACYAATDWSKFGYKPTPEKGFVPDEKTAIAIAVAVWTPIYGSKQIAGQKPYQATLKDNEWHITGSLPDGGDGGVAEAIISKKDGQILAIWHGK